MPSSSFTGGANIKAAGTLPRVVHQKVVGVDNAADATKVRPTDWHADHLLLGVPVAVIVSPSSDTYIDSQSATTNNDSAAEVTVGGDPADTSFSRRVLFTFDTSFLSGKTVISARLRMFRSNTSTNTLQVGTQMVGFRVLRAYSPTQVTWNVYSTGNNWTTAGARSAGNDVASTRHALGIMGVTSSDVNCWYDFDVVTLVKESLESSETTLRMLIQFNETDTAQNATNWASQNSATATARPTMAVVYV